MLNSPARLPARNFISFLLALSLALLLAACAPITPEDPAADAPTAPATIEGVQEIPQTEYQELSAVFVGERIPAFMPEAGSDFDAVARYVDWIGDGSGVPVTLTSLASDTPMTAADLLASVQNDVTLRDAIAAADIVVVGAPTGDLPWVSATDSCDGDDGDRPDWATYTPECATAVVEAAQDSLTQLYAEVTSLRQGLPTVLRTANHFNTVIGLFNRNADPGEATRTILEPWNNSLCQAAEAAGFVCTNLHRRFNGEEGTRSAENLLYVLDKSKLSESGSEVVASVLIDTGYGELIAAGAKEHPLASLEGWIAAILRYEGIGFSGTAEDFEFASELWIMRPDGSRAHQIATDNRERVATIGWSPDGARIALEVRTNPFDEMVISRVWEYDFASDRSRMLAVCGAGCSRVYEPDYAPDGQRILTSQDFGASPQQVSDACGLVVTDLTTGESIRITETTPCDPEISPRWSPVGQSIVFMREKAEGAGEEFTVNIINADGSDERILNAADSSGAEPAWSPDGMWVYFSSGAVTQELRGINSSNIYRVRPDGTELTQLTFLDGRNQHAMAPSVSPDGEWLFFMAQDGAGYMLWAMPAEGGEPVVVRRGGTVSWRFPLARPPQ